MTICLESDTIFCFSRIQNNRNLQGNCTTIQPFLSRLHETVIFKSLTLVCILDRHCLLLKVETCDHMFAH